MRETGFTEIKVLLGPVHFKAAQNDCRTLLASMHVFRCGLCHEQLLSGREIVAGYCSGHLARLERLYREQRAWFPKSTLPPAGATGKGRVSSVPAPSHPKRR